MGASEKVRAKFRVTELATVEASRIVEGRLVPGVAGKVHLAPVTSGSPENTAFFAATPSGAITLQIVSEQALAAFAVGREFYVDFIPAS